MRSWRALSATTATNLGVSLLPAFAVSREVEAGQPVALPIDRAVLALARRRAA
ncbi:hypothetical protein [Xylophilus ampelinus]|uniref:hypothetical protein n=1 Tax=Xylophilus ampelinus TaxID=54067 RepID=UPI0013145EC3|nr:hypothetical protein [Xylophilus ampelinus]MCS4511860.1 hypothetical protein [Xylophilus ampelinus]